MNTILIILAFVCMAVGIVGAVAPGLPGPPVAWAGLLLAYIAGVAVGTPLLIAAAALAAVITVLDYVVPGVSTRRYGGSKWGVWGCNIGLVVSIIGLPFGPQGLLGVVVWPFVGALVGEWLKQRELRPALRAAWGAFVGFLGGTLMKLAYCVAVLVVTLSHLL